MTIEINTALAAQDVFRRLFSSDEILLDVAGAFFINDVGPSMLVQIRLSFTTTVVLLSAREDDTVSVSHNEQFDDAAHTEILSLNEVSPWKEARTRPLLWAWTMTNQFQAIDGLQLDFAHATDSPAVRIQLLVMGSEFKLQPG